VAIARSSTALGQTGPAARSVPTLTPYDHWRRCHAVHYATGGNLDQRGIGDVHTLTVAGSIGSAWRAWSTG
jgi:omega-6 fatty acid desaturase (delta-12 desaturase)